jgi:hypothetical protein
MASSDPDRPDSPDSHPPATESNMSSGAPAALAKFCSHCGQAIGPSFAARAVASAYCCNCGAVLDLQAKCPNAACKFYGYQPRCGDAGSQLA